MNKRIKDVITMFLGSGINILLGMVTVPIITYIVEPDIYGRVSLIQTYISIFVTFSVLGLDQAYVRFFFGVDNLGYKRRLSRKVLFIPVIISLVITILICVFSPSVLKMNSYIGTIIGLCVLFTVVESFIKLSVRLDQKAKLYTTMSIVHRIAYAAIIIILILIFQTNVLLAMLLGTLLSIMISGLVGLISERKIWFGGYAKETKVITYHELLRYSIPFIFSSIAGWAFNAADKIALQYYSSYEQIGFYSAAANIVALTAIFQTTFSTIWVPIAVQTFERNPENKTFFVKSNNIMTVIMVGTGATLILVKNIFDIVLGGNYHTAKYIFPCLLLHPIMFTLSETTVYGINFYKKTYWHIVITVVSCVFNIMLNFTLVPRFGGRGAAISTGLAYILFFVIRTLAARKYFEVDFPKGKLCFVIGSFTIYAVYNTFFDTNIISVFLYLGIVAAIVLLYRSTISDLIKMVLSGIKRK